MTYGGQVAPAAIEAWSAAAPDARWGTYWGQSELSQLGTVGWFARLADIPGGGDPSWIGKPVSHLEVRVVDEDGDDAELGELICRSPSVMLGYHRDPERTKAVARVGLAAHRRHRARRRRGQPVLPRPAHRRDQDRAA